MKNVDECRFKCRSKGIYNEVCLKVFVLVFIVFASLFSKHEDIYAIENVSLVKEIQIDLKNNIAPNRYGNTDHYVYTYDKVVTENFIIVNMIVQDYPNYAYLINFYDLDGRLLKSIRNEGILKFKAYECGDSLIIVSLQKKYGGEVVEVQKYDNNLNLISKYSDPNYAVSGISFNNVVFGYNDDGLEYKLAYIDYDNVVYFFTLDNDLNFKKLKRYTDLSFNYRIKLYMHPNNTVWAQITYTGRRQFDKYLNIENATKLIYLSGAWPYYDDYIQINNVIMLKDGNVLLTGGNRNILIDSQDNWHEIVDLSGYKEDLFYNGIVNEFERLEILKDVFLSCENKILIIEKDNEILDSFEFDSLRLFEATQDYVVFREQYSDVYYVITRDAKVKRIESKENVLKITDERIYISDFVSGERKLNEKICIYKLNDAPLIDLGLTRKNVKDEKLYVGNSGLDIEGIIYNVKNKTCKISMMINGVTKEESFLSPTDEYRFNLHWTIDELFEWEYENLYISLETLDEKNKYAEEIELGSIVCYQNEMYQKIGEDLYIEHYPVDSNAYVMKDVTAKENLLSIEEFDRCKANIDNQLLYGWWLKDNAACNVAGNRENVISPKYYFYLRRLKDIDRRKKFRLNKVDNVYYEDNSSDIRCELGFNILVSKDIPDIPNVVLSDEHDGYLNHDVFLDVLNIQEGEKCYFQYLGEIYSFEDRIVISNEGINVYEFWKENIYGNKSRTVIKAVKIDKTAPELVRYSFENVSENWTGTQEIKVIFEILEDCSGFSHETLMKYKPLKNKNGLYEIYITCFNEDFINFEVIDNASNILSINLPVNFKVDATMPEFTKEQFRVDGDGAYVELEAYDLESGIKGIFYAINDMNFQEYNGKIFLSRKLYDRNTVFKYYAVDKVNNKTDVHIRRLDLNSLVSISIVNRSELKKEVSLEDRECFRLEILDDDSNDEFDMNIFIKYLNGELVDELFFKNVTRNFKYDIPNEIIEELEYDKEVIICFEATDGIVNDKVEYKFKKINMRPTIKIDYVLDEYYENFIELFILAEDLDGDEMQLKVFNSLDREIYSKKVLNGKNIIYLNNHLKVGNQKVKLVLSDGYNRVQKTISFMVKPKLELRNNEVFVLKLRHVKSIEFYNMINDAIAGDIVLVLVQDLFDDDIKINNINLASSKLYLEHDMKIYDEYDENEEYEYDFSAFNQNLLDESIRNVISKRMSSKTKNVFEVNELIKLKNFSFYDYEEDYYENQFGNERIIKIEQDGGKFENLNGDYDLNARDVLYEDFNLCVNNKTKEELEFRLDKVGKYTISVREKDYIYNGGTNYSKYSDDFVNVIYVHRKPVVNLDYEFIDDRHVKVLKNAYDLDFYSKNKGISFEELIIAKRYYDGKVEILDVNKLDLNFLEISEEYCYEIRYKAKDYGIDCYLDELIGVFEDEVSIEIHLREKDVSTCDFYYAVGGVNANGYAYKGNVGIEKVDFVELVNVKNKALINDVSYMLPKEEFNNVMLEISEGNGTLKNQLFVDYAGNVMKSNEKSLLVKNLLINNLSYENYDDVEKGFLKDKLAFLKFEVINAADEDISLYCNGDEMVCLGDGIYTYLYDLASQEFADDCLRYVIEVYSRRDGALLYSKEYMDSFFERVEILDFRIVKIYDPSFSMINGDIENNLHEMPYIKKGYAFDFEIVTKGMSDNDDYLLIRPFFHLNKSFNWAKVYTIGSGNNIILDGRVIGNANLIYLNREHRVKNEEYEVWNGRYYVSHEVEFCLDDNLIKEDIILNLTLEAYKNGILKHVYIPTKSNIFSVGGEDFLNGDVVGYKSNLLFDLNTYLVY